MQCKKREGGAQGNDDSPSHSSFHHDHQRAPSDLGDSPSSVHASSRPCPLSTMMDLPRPSASGQHTHQQSRLSAAAADASPSTCIFPAALWQAQCCSFSVLGNVAMLAATTHYEGLLRPAAVKAAPRQRHTRPAHVPRLEQSAASNRPVFRRRITSDTVLRCMYVTRAMAACLDLPDEEVCLFGSAAAASGSSPVGPPGCQGGGSVRAPTTPHGCASSPPPSARTAHRSGSLPKRLKQWLVILLDTSGNVWPVTYEAVLTCGQYHRRFSQGWRDFSRHHALRSGDAVLFRRCPPGDGCTMTVRIVRSAHA